MGSELSNNNIDVTKVSGTKYDPVFKGILEEIPGGGTLIAAEMPSDLTVLGEATMIVESSSTSGLWHLVKTQKSTSTQTTSTSITLLASAKYKSLFKVGEYIGFYGGGTLSTITSITHTAATTDTIVTEVAIGVLATASIIERGSAASLATAGPLYNATALTRNVIRVREDDLTTLNNVNVGIVVRGTVNESLLPKPPTTDDKTDLTDRIRYA